MKILSLSPQNSYPAMAGGARRFFELNEALERCGAEVELLFLNGGGAPSTISWTGAAKRSSSLKKMQMLWALMQQRTYNEVAFAKESWFRKNQRVMAKDFDLVHVHFLCAYPNFSKYYDGTANVVVDTHNDDWSWWEAFRNGGVLGRVVSRFGMKRTDEIIRMVPDGTLLTHVSGDDCRAYMRRAGNLRHHILPNGCGPVRVVGPKARRKKAKCRLVFFGSLSSKINVDAIRYFSSNIWMKIADLADVVVAGSRPQEDVARICEKRGWRLEVDLDNAGIDRIYGQSDFSILPFGYGNGSKHKVFESVCRGVPIIGTEGGYCGIREKCEGFIICKSADEWRQAIVGSEQNYTNLSASVINWAKGQAWDRHARDFLKIVTRR